MVFDDVYSWDTLAMTFFAAATLVLAIVSVWILKRTTDINKRLLELEERKESVKLAIVSVYLKSNSKIIVILKNEGGRVLHLDGIYEYAKRKLLLQLDVDLSPETEHIEDFFLEDIDIDEKTTFLLEYYDQERRTPKSVPYTKYFNASMLNYKV